MKAISTQPSAFSKNVGTQNETRENTMLTYNDQTKARFPLSLDGRGARGEGVFAALLLGCMALLAAPQAVMAQVNPGCTGTNPGTINCPYGDYSGTDGISHTSNGDLQINFDMGEASDGLEDTTPNPTGVSNYETGGTVTTAGNVGDNLSIFATGNYNSNVFFSQDFPILFDVESQAGDIGFILDTTVEDFDISVGNKTHFARLISTAGGNIRFSGGGSDGDGEIRDSDIGIEARSLGGDGDVSIDLLTQVLGEDYGILAEVENAGEIDIETVERVGGDIAAIAAFADTGDINLSVNSVLSDNIGIDTITDGVATINIAGGQVTGDVAALRGSGNSAVVNLSGPAQLDLKDYSELLGRVDFSGMTGTVTTNIGANAVWLPRGTSNMSSGDDIVTVADDGLVHLELYGSSSGGERAQMEEPVVIDFGTGENSFNNNGTILIGTETGSNLSDLEDGQSISQPEEYEAELRFENLATFTNAGNIYLGSDVWLPGQAGSGGLSWTVLGTDLFNDDILAMPGATFVGEEGSRVFVDVNLNLGGQGGCDASMRNPDNGDLPAADCIDLKGGGASGQTGLVVTDLIPGDRGSYAPDGIVLVDLSGGSADVSPDAFVLDPASSHYNPVVGGVVDKGMFWYPVAYDADARQFKLYGVPGAVGQQQPIMASAAQELWRNGAGTWFDRQGDLRDSDREAGNGGGVWFRATDENAERSVTSLSAAAGNTFAIDNEHDLNTATINFGADLLTGSEANRSWVLGATAGYSHATMDFDVSESSTRLDGISLGVYGGYVGEHLFVDALVSGNWLKLRHDAPSLGLEPETAILNGRIESLGARAEAGWRFGSGQVRIEPLVSLAYISSTFDEVNVPAADPTRAGITVKWEDPKSFRGGLGLRGTMDMPTDALLVRLALTGRLIEEFEGENRASLNTFGASAPTLDDFSGTYTEINPAISIASNSGSVSATLNLNLKYGDDYQSSGLSAGFRYQW